MIEVDTSVEISQPIEKVFDFVTTPENDAQWYLGIESRDHTPDEPSGVGSTSQSIIRFLGIPMTVTWEVTDYARPTKIAVKSIEGPVSVTAGYTFEGTAVDKTKVTVHGEADVGSVFRVAEPIVERMARRQWAASFENLKDVLEAA